ncbi:hypothetical protein [Roseobacter sp.]|uniref:hypothetical protein n=1 Tax=Roseobacter sp. TaxID=1907202 RepID=UPI0032975256
MNTQTYTPAQVAKIVQRIQDHNPDAKITVRADAIIVESKSEPTSIDYDSIDMKLG